MDLGTIANLLLATAAAGVVVALRRLGPCDGDDIATVIAALGTAPRDRAPLADVDGGEAVRWRLELLTPRTRQPEQAARPGRTVPKTLSRAAADRV